MKICLCTAPGASQKYARCEERSGSCSLRQDLGKRVLGAFRKILAQRAHLEEGKAAVHPTSTLRQASHDAPLCKGTTQQPVSLPTAGDPRKKKLEGDANFQVVQVASSFVLLPKSHC